MKKREAKHFYVFGVFRIDVGERVLLSEKGPVSLTPKAFDLLLFLVENSGHILDKEELMKQVWPDSFVEENNLAQNISTLRKVLDDGGAKFIQTVPRRGYRFAAEVGETWQEPPELMVRERTRSRIVIEEEIDKEDELTSSAPLEAAVVQRPAHIERSSTTLALEPKPPETMYAR